jgi:glutamate formiminotransferase
VLAATQALCREAFSSIDMRGHQGAHPRMGAVDVIPFVPLRGVTSEEAVALARRLGRWIGEQGVPVYYYQEAATRLERESLPDVRRGEYEGLAARLATPEGAPDAGPAVFNERSGASIVGVRFPLVAFNVNLATDDLSIARRIAEAVRFSGGGYRYVRAMGVALEGKGQVQVATDILHYDRTPIHRVLETVRSEAARYGVAVAGCELIGLAPLDALAEAIRHYLQIHEFSSSQIIESRLLEV